MTKEQPFDFDQLPRSTGEFKHESATEAENSRGRSQQADKVEWKRGNVDYFKLLMRYKWWLLCGMISGVLVGHLLFQRLGPEYDATRRPRYWFPSESPCQSATTSKLKRGAIDRNTSL